MGTGHLGEQTNRWTKFNA